MSRFSLSNNHTYSTKPAPAGTSRWHQLAEDDYWRFVSGYLETIAAHLSEPFADEFIDQVLRMDTTLLITDDPVKRVDNMTMAWGLEARVPFLDHQLVELAASMPPSWWRVRGCLRKRRYPPARSSRLTAPSRYSN